MPIRLTTTEGPYDHGRPSGNGPGRDILRADRIAHTCGDRRPCARVRSDFAPLELRLTALPNIHPCDRNIARRPLILTLRDQI
jgi:hypothetical protein